MRIFSGRDTATAFSRTVCDGVDIWNLWYNGISSSGDLWTPIAEECIPVALQWDALLDSLQAAVLVGKDATLGCAYVRAEYATPPSPIVLNPQGYQLRPDARVLCIDEVSKAILWERFNAGSFVMSLTKIERDPVFGPDEFKIPEVSFRRTDNARRTDRLLQLLWDLPLHFCVSASPNVGCVANPFVLK